VVLRPPAPLSDRSALRLRWDGAGSSELATEAGRPHRRRAFVAARPSARSGSPTRSGRSLGGPSTTRLPASRRPLIRCRLRRTRTPETTLDSGAARASSPMPADVCSQLPVAVSSVGLCAIIPALPRTISKLACQLRASRARVRGSWSPASACCWPGQGPRPGTGTRTPGPPTRISGPGMRTGPDAQFTVSAPGPVLGEKKRGRGRGRGP
jgi:hypothetical protein